MTAYNASTFLTELNRLANGGVTPTGAFSPLLDEAGAANKYAGSTALATLGALNFKAGNLVQSAHLGINAVCNQLAGTSGLEARDALAAMQKPAAPSPAPTAVAGAPASLNATVTFTPVVTTPPVLSYTATSSPGGLTATGAGSPLVVGGLTATTIYTFTVHANNALGAGPESAASNAITAQ